MKRTLSKISEIGLFCFLAFCNGAIAGQLAESDCSVRVRDLHPTQVAIGQKEVEIRKEKIRNMTPEKLAAYLEKHAGTTVLGPNRKQYLTDGHHLARALSEAGLPDLCATQTEDLSSLSETEFWERMKAEKLVYLYDESGHGPLDPSYLPNTLAEMRDDAYRSLAWGVRKAGGYEASSSEHADFAWANFFRTRIPLSRVKEDFEQSVEIGKALAESKEAEGLPGYHGGQ